MKSAKNNVTAITPMINSELKRYVERNEQDDFSGWGTHSSEPATKKIGVATSVIGIKIEPCLFFNDKRVKTYDHKYPDDYDYDPKTGKRLWVNNPEPIQEAHGVCHLDEHFENPRYVLSKYKSWPVFSIFEDKTSQIIGIGGCSDGKTSFIPLGQISDIKERLKDDLEPLDLWADGLFGLYSAFSII